MATSPPPRPKGTVGRPPGSGRPNSSSLGIDGRIAARQHAEDAIKTLVEIMKNSNAPAAARVTASENILNRAFGKPAQAVELTGKDGNPIEHQAVSDAERFTSSLLGLVAREAAAQDGRKSEH